MSDKHYIGLDVISFEDNGKQRPVSRVTLFLDDENYFTAGDDTGRELSALCPSATQEMVDNLLLIFKGYEHQTFSAKGANIDPAAELGDGVNVCGVYSALSEITDNGGFPDISAPGEAESEDEYPYESPMQKELNRKTAEVRVIALRGLVIIEGLGTGTTVVDGACVRTGKISDQKGLNYWDLENGKLVLTNTEINGTGGSVKFTNCPIYTIASKTWKAADYTLDEMDVITQLVLHNNATAEQVERYDFDLDGKISMGDAVLLRNMVNSGLDGTTSWMCQLDPENELAVLRVWNERKWGAYDGSGYITRENVAFQAGTGGVRVSSLHSEDDMTVGSDDNTVCHTGNTGLSANILPSVVSPSNTSASASYPAGTFGFWVSGYTIGGSALAGTFVPIALCEGTTQFQFADEGNFVSFTIKADTATNTVIVTYVSGSATAGEINYVCAFHCGSK